MHTSMQSSKGGKPQIANFELQYRNAGLVISNPSYFMTTYAA